MYEAEEKSESGLLRVFIFIDISLFKPAINGHEIDVALLTFIYYFFIIFPRSKIFFSQRASTN